MKTPKLTHNSTHSQAFEALQIALTWFEGQSEDDFASILVLKRARDLADLK